MAEKKPRKTSKAKAAVPPPRERKVTQVFLGKFSLEDYMMKEARLAAIKFRQEHEGR